MINAVLASAAADGGPVTLQLLDGSSEELTDVVVRILGFVLLAGSVGTATALVYRWYSGEAIPDGVAVLTGVAVVAAWLNTKSLLDQAIIGGAQPFDSVTAVYTVVVIAASAIAADVGRRLGDHLATDVVAATPRTITDVEQFVRSAGRTVAVTLPEEIDDLEGYDPVSAETKEALAGETLLFPRRLDPPERRMRLEERLERDYGFEMAVAELDEEGAVTALAVGSRRAGLGPTLAPGQVACAIAADPSPDATPGDAVAVWDVSAPGDAGDAAAALDRASRPTRVTEGELRGTIDDVATIAVAADDARRLDGVAYRLVTLPGAPDAGREFVSTLRRVPETMTTVRVADTEGGEPGVDGGLAGESVGALPVAVLVVDRGGDPIAFPDDDVRLEAGDVAYVLGGPDALERVRERNG